jgi:hypothetical protein
MQAGHMHQPRLRAYMDIQRAADGPCDMPRLREAGEVEMNRHYRFKPGYLVECKYCGNKRFYTEPLHICRYGQLLDYLEYEIGRVGDSKMTDKLEEILAKGVRTNYCLDCEILVSDNDYGNHNADHTFKNTVLYDKEAVKEAFAAGHESRQGKLELHHMTHMEGCHFCKIWAEELIAKGRKEVFDFVRNHKHADGINCHTVLMEEIRKKFGVK